MKYRCILKHMNFTVGRVYTLINNTFIDDFGKNRVGLVERFELSDIPVQFRAVKYDTKVGKLFWTAPFCPYPDKE